MFGPHISEHQLQVDVQYILMSRTDGFNRFHPQTIGYIERQQYNPTIELSLNLSRVLDGELDSIFSSKPFELLDDKTLRSTAGH